MSGTRCAFVNQQVAHRNVGVTQVGTEDRFAEEVIESTTSRMTTVESSALVPRAVKLSVTGSNILREAAEEGRKESVFILLSGRINLTAIEFTVGFVTVEYTAEVTDRNTFLSSSVSKNGNIEVRVLDGIKFAFGNVFGSQNDCGNFREIGAVKVHDFALRTKRIFNSVAYSNFELFHD